MAVSQGDGCEELSSLFVEEVANTEKRVDGKKDTDKNDQPALDKVRKQEADEGDRGYRDGIGDLSRNVIDV